MNSLPIDSGRVGATPSAGGGSGGSTSGASSGGAVFQALLDRLAQSAQRLEASEGAVTDADSLADADEDARSALTDALSLKDQLLEAYRQRRAQGA